MYTSEVLPRKALFSRRGAEKAGKSEDNIKHICLLDPRFSNSVSALRVSRSSAMGGQAQ